MALITTTRGLMDEQFLEKTVGIFENENEKTTWTEYRIKGTPEPRVENGVCLDCLDKVCGHVHRSADIFLKKGMFADSTVGGFQ